MYVETKESKKLNRSVVPIRTMKFKTDFKYEVNVIHLWMLQWIRKFLFRISLCHLTFLRGLLVKRTLCLGLSSHNGLQNDHGFTISKPRIPCCVTSV